MRSWSLNNLPFYAWQHFDVSTWIPAWEPVRAVLARVIAHVAQLPRHHSDNTDRHCGFAETLKDVPHGVANDPGPIWTHIGERDLRFSPQSQLT